MDEIGKVIELDLQIGDIISEVNRDGSINSELWVVVSNSGCVTVTAIENRILCCNLALSMFFKVVRRYADNIPFGRLSDEEKGRLLLAQYEGQEIIRKMPNGLNVVLVKMETFQPHLAYEIVEPSKIETVVAGWSLEHGVTSGLWDENEYQITWVTTDGVPDTSTVKMDKIV